MTTTHPINTEPTSSELPDIFAPVTVTNAVYKTIGAHSLLAPIIIPKALPSGSKAPIIIRYHGGAMISGSALEPRVYPHWLLELAVRHRAVIVSPNVRLLPESTPADQLDDMEDAWCWVRSDLGSHLQGVVPDLDRVLLVGDSAGGWNALIQAMAHADEIRATALLYPMLDMAAAHYTAPIDPTTNPKPGFKDIPADPKEKYDEHLKNNKDIVWADASWTRMWMIPTFFHHGLYASFFPPHERYLLPLAWIENGTALPKGGVVILHGEEDVFVPIDGSLKVQAAAKEGVSVVVKKGAAHGFDVMPEPMGLYGWIEDALMGVVEAWLA